MLYSYLIQGYVLGFSVATTIGISGVLCLQNMMTGNRSVGFASALAAALADMSCGIIVIFGLHALQDVLVVYKGIISMVAGIFLCALGLYKIFGKLQIVSHHVNSNSLLTAFGSVYFLAILDPVSVMDFMAICVGLTLEFSVLYNAYAFVMGLFFGSATWWFSLGFIIMMLRKSFSVELLQRIQIVIGVGIFALGLWTMTMIWRS